MTGPLALAGAALLLVGAGAGIRRLMRAVPNSPLEACASAVVLGIAACGVLGSLAAAAGLPVPRATAAGLAALTLAGLRRPKWAPAPGDGVAALLLAVPVLLVAIRAFTLPMAFGDEIGNWGYKSAAFFASGDIEPRAWSLAASRGPSYPPSIPVAGTLAGVLAGSFDPASARLVAILAYLALACALAECLRGSLAGVPRALAALGLACAPRVLFEAPHFMADTALTASIALAATSLLRAPHAWIAAAHLAAVPLLKVDGAPIAAAVALAAVAFAPRLSRGRAALRIAAVGVAANVPWLALLGARGVLELVEQAAAAARANPAFGTLPERIGGSLRSLVSALVPGGWRSEFGLIAPALALLALAGPSPRAELLPRRLATAIAAAIVAGQVAAVALAPYPTPWLLEVVQARTAMHLLPALCLAAAAARAPPRVP